LKPLEEALSAWSGAYPAQVAAQAAAEGARQAKDSARAALEKEVRPITNFVQRYPKTVNADRAEMGITVRYTSPSPAPAPITRPPALVESGQRLTHHLRPTAAPSSEPDVSALTWGRNDRARRVRPAGVLGAEVWLKLVEPNGQILNGQVTKSDNEPRTLGDPAQASGDPSTCGFLTMTTRPTSRAEFKRGEGGTNWGSRRLHGPLDQHTRGEGAVVGGCDSSCRSMTGDGGGVREFRESRR